MWQKQEDLTRANFLPRLFKESMTNRIETRAKTEEFQDSNCIGYVYFRLRLQAADRFMNPLTKEEILRDFEVVETAQEAEVLAIVETEGYETADHMAIIEPGGEHIAHRPKYGVPVRFQAREEVEREYLQTGNYAIVYLKRRS